MKKQFSIKRISSLLLAVYMVLMMMSCAAQKNSAPHNETKEHYVISEITSRSLQNNLIGVQSEKRVFVYLPPSYYSSTKNYPVVYYLPGYGESADAFVLSQKVALDENFANGAQEFIMVGIDSITRYGGSFYENSPSSGNWEDFIIQEIVPHIDRTFKTISSKDSRGICGFSMGGYGAYNLAFKHPDVFAAFLTMSPGAIADGDFPATFDSWRYSYNFQVGYGQAFSPNTQNTTIYANIPTFDGSAEDAAIIADWKNGYGNLSQKIDTYLAKNIPLRGIRIRFGERDLYEWIPRGCRALAEKLEERGIAFTIESDETGHAIPTDVSKNEIVPFFNEFLDYQSK